MFFYLLDKFWKLASSPLFVLSWSLSNPPPIFQSTYNVCPPPPTFSSPLAKLAPIFMSPQKSLPLSLSDPFLILCISSSWPILHQVSKSDNLWQKYHHQWSEQRYWRWKMKNGSTILFAMVMRIADSNYWLYFFQMIFKSYVQPLSNKTKQKILFI